MARGLFRLPPTSLEGTVRKRYHPEARKHFQDFLEFGTMIKYRAMNNHIEDQVPLTPKFFGKDWDRIRQGEEFEVKIPIKGGNTSVHYWAENVDGEMRLGLSNGTDTQKIHLKRVELHYGSRLLFICPTCDRACCALYIQRENKKESWRCSKCCKLIYESSRINRGSKLGKIAYILYWMGKGDKIMAKIGQRRVYDRKSTHGLVRAMKAYGKCGIKECIEPMERFMTMIRDLRRGKNLTQRI